MESEIKEVANEPFEETIGGKPFKFRNIGMGRALAIISSWLLKRLRDEIRNNSMAFEDVKERAVFVREELGKLPKGKKLGEAALEALCGDKAYIDSNGAEGSPPIVDEDLLRDLIVRGHMDTTHTGLLATLDLVEQDPIAKLALRVMGIRTERDKIVDEAGGDVPKKAS